MLKIDSCSIFRVCNVVVNNAHSREAIGVLIEVILAAIMAKNNTLKCTIAVLL